MVQATMINQHMTYMAHPAYARQRRGPRFLCVARQGLLVTMSLCFMIAVGGCSKESDHSVNTSTQDGMHIVMESFGNTLGMRFRYVPPGEFIMGSSSDSKADGIPEVYLQMEVAHAVEIKQGFCIQTTEVTNEQFQEFVAASGYRIRETAQ